jgi:hypothetical protein
MSGRPAEELRLSDPWCGMGGKAKRATATPVPAPAPVAVSPTIHEAARGVGGAVIKGAQITLAQAEARRKAGLDVVVCGPTLGPNSNLAQTIEANANGTWKRCPPHATAGPNALPHYQPDPRPPAGHTFYETPNRKAI